jgi:hypothetical protein
MRRPESSAPCARAFQRRPDRGGPGGWWIATEVEVLLEGVDVVRSGAQHAFNGHAQGPGTDSSATGHRAERVAIAVCVFPQNWAVDPFSRRVLSSKTNVRTGGHETWPAKVAGRVSLSLSAKRGCRAHARSTMGVRSADSAHRIPPGRSSGPAVKGARTHGSTRTVSITASNERRSETLCPSANQGTAMRSALSPLSPRPLRAY